MSIRVSNTRRSDSGPVTSHGSDTRGVRDSEAPVFSRTLTNLSREVHEARLVEMKNAIDEQGKLLEDRVDVREFEKYRRLLRDFLDEIVSNGYTFCKEDAYASRGKHRYIATVRVINEKLDEMGKEFLKEQADRIEILHRIDDIRGLLLDLMM